MRGVHIEEVRCKTILNAGTFGAGSYTLNAYHGCAFGCSYCYVPVLRARRRQDDALPWGRWVQVKTNAPEVLRRQMLDLPDGARIFIGTATDSWQPVEKQYGVSRRILEELAYYPNHVSIVTRSPLIIRDIDIMRRMQDLSVHISLPTFDERARRVFEPNAPAVKGRCEAVRRLLRAGVRVGLMWCPLLPGVTDTEAALQAYAEQAAALGVRRVAVGLLGYLPAVGARHAKLVAEYRGAMEGADGAALTRKRLHDAASRWLRRYGINAPDQETPRTPGGV